MARSSLFELYQEARVMELYEDQFMKEQYNLVANEARWENVFEMDNVFYFNEKVWMEFIKKKPIIWLNNQWVQVYHNKFFKNLYREQGIILNIYSWRLLRKFADEISITADINSSRNNHSYLKLLREFEMDQRVKHMLEWLKSIEKDALITKEGYQLLHQQCCQLSLRRNLQFSQEWLLQNHTHFQEVGKGIRHIHIILPRSKRSNLWLRKYLELHNILKCKQQLSITDNLTKQEAMNYF
jgi:hypothetical protein